MIVQALSTSTKVFGLTKLNIRNDKEYDEKNVFDLSQLKFQIFELDFSRKTVDELMVWIGKAITNQLNLYHVNLQENIDYIISNFSEQTLRDFINVKVKTDLTLEMIATDESNLAKNSCEINLINNPEFPVAPPKPPLPPDPNKGDPDKWDPNTDENFFNQNKIWIATTIVVIALGESAIGTFFWYKKIRVGVENEENRKKRKEVESMNENIIPKNIKKSKLEFWRGIGVVEILIILVYIGVLSLIIFTLSVNCKYKFAFSFIGLIMIIPLLVQIYPGVKGWYALVWMFKFIAKKKQFKE